MQAQCQIVGVAFIYCSTGLLFSSVYQVYLYEGLCKKYISLKKGKKCFVPDLSYQLISICVHGVLY